MKDAERKNLETKLFLAEEIMQADMMILHNIRYDAGNLMSSIIEPKMFFKEGQETVELTAEEFTKLRLFLAHLDLKVNKLGGLNNCITKYVDSKEEKQKIFNML